jgi:hypothetical protein
MDLGISKFLADAASHLSAYVIALSIIGGVSMALLQTLKDLLPTRQWFQSYYLKKWMEEGAAEARKNLDNPSVSASKAEQDLLTMAVDGDAAALYDLQIEQLCGQYTAAIQMVLEFPSAHVDLLAVTASQANSADINLVLAGPTVPPTQAFLDARNRVTHQCQRAIDALQITAGFRWKWMLQIASIVLSGVLAWVAMAYGPGTIAANPFSIVVSAILAGFLAPVGKDLLAVLQRARGQ